jgi:hypothetical protein
MKQKKKVEPQRVTNSAEDSRCNRTKNLKKKIIFLSSQRKNAINVKVKIVAHSMDSLLNTASPFRKVGDLMQCLRKAKEWYDGRCVRARGKKA